MQCVRLSLWAQTDRRTDGRESNVEKTSFLQELEAPPPQLQTPELLRLWIGTVTINQSYMQKKL